MQLQPITIKPELLPYVKSFWVLKSNDDASIQEKTFRTMADGCPGFIYQPSHSGTLYQSDKKLSETFIFGQTTRHAQLELDGTFNAIGIIFQPSALRLIFGFDAEELTDSCVDADQLCQQQESILSEKLNNSTGLAHQIDAIVSFLMRHISNGKKHEDQAMQYALERLIQTDGNTSLKLIQNYLQLSERSFQRHFKRYTGISPKLFARICSFQASLKRIQQSGRKLTDVAFEQHYADQSHFIRSFKEFAGVSPNQYLRQNNIITNTMI